MIKCNTKSWKIILIKKCGFGYSHLVHVDKNNNNLWGKLLPLTVSSVHCGLNADINFLLLIVLTDHWQSKDHNIYWYKNLLVTSGMIVASAIKMHIPRFNSAYQCLNTEADEYFSSLHLLCCMHLRNYKAKPFNLNGKTNARWVKLESVMFCDMLLSFKALVFAKPQLNQIELVCKCKVLFAPCMHLSL